MRFPFIWIVVLRVIDFFSIILAHNNILAMCIFWRNSSSATHIDNNNLLRISHIEMAIKLNVNQNYVAIIPIVFTSCMAFPHGVYNF